MPTIRKRGRVWYADLYIGGRRVRVKLSTDRRVADAKLAELIAERDGSRYGHAAQGVTWDSFCEKYMAYSRGSKKGSTPARDQATIRAMNAFERPAKLADVTPEHLERWRGFRKGNGIGQATIARDLGAAKAMMRKAAAWGYVKALDWSSVKIQKSTRGRLIFFTIGEMRVLLRHARTTFPEFSHNEAPHDWVTVAMLGARAGLRRGEMAHAAWADFDAKRRSLAITPKDCPCCPGGRWEPKDYEQRHLPLPADLVKHLAGLKRTNQWILGTRPSLGTITNYFRRIVKKAGLKGSTHTLRHTYASHLAQAGVPLYTISKLLGHADMNMTKIYAHLCPQTYEASVDKLPHL